MLRATTVPVSFRASRACVAPRPGVSKCVPCTAPPPGPCAAQHTLYPVQRPPSHVGDATPPCCPTFALQRQRSLQVRAERRDERSGLPEPPPTADDFLTEGTRPRNFWDVMTFAGWAGGAGEALCNSEMSAGAPEAVTALAAALACCSGLASYTVLTQLLHPCPSIACSPAPEVINGRLVSSRGGGLGCA